jgi:hypothetical protein
VSSTTEILPEVMFRVQQCLVFVVVIVVLVLVLVVVVVVVEDVFVFIPYIS